MVRTRRHKLTLEMNSGAGELYDLHDDPHELVNRFDDPAFAALRKELAEMIASSRSGRAMPDLPVVGTA